MEEYCIQDCEKKDVCKHRLITNTLAPEEAFQRHQIEKSECSFLNGWIRYSPDLDRLKKKAKQ